MQARQRVFRIGLVAVKEMLGIEQRLAPQFAQMGKRLGDVVAVLVQRDPERGGDMEIMGLADEADRFGARVQHARQDIVVIRRPSRPFGHAKGGKGGTGLGRGGEEIGIGRICPGPAALDIVYTERVERRGDLVFFGAGELDPLGLLAIPQGGIEKVEALFGHWTCPFRPWKPRAAPIASVTTSLTAAPPVFPRRNLGLRLAPRPLSTCAPRPQRPPAQISAHRRGRNPLSPSP